MCNNIYVTCKSLPLATKLASELACSIERQEDVRTSWIKVEVQRSCDKSFFFIRQMSKNEATIEERVSHDCGRLNDDMQTADVITTTSFFFVKTTRVLLIKRPVI